MKCRSLSIILLSVLILLALAAIAMPQATKRRPVRTTTPKEVVRLEAPDSSAPPPPKSVESKAPITLGVSVEKYVDDIVVNGDGTAVQTWELEQKVTKQSAVEYLKKVVRPFNGDLESFEAWDAYILKPDGKKIAIPDSDIKIRRTPQAEAAPSFSSMMIGEVNFTGLQIGDSLHYRARLKTLKPYFGNNFDRLDYLTATIDWRSAEIRLTAPLDYPLHIQAVDLDGGRAENENGKAHWVWKKENFKAAEYEVGMYDYLSVSPRLAITSYASYEDLGAAYWAEASKKTEVTPEIQKLADEITKDAKTPTQQAYAIYDWINKNVRYLSLVLDRSGWVPHSSAEILANRYGDCKDYTTVLNSLLRAKGIESYPVIIRADMTDWFPEVAAPSFFNHAILYIPGLDLFADATSPNTRLGLIPQLIVGKKAFLAGTKNGVISIPRDRPDENQILSDVSITFTQDGKLKAISKNTFQGRNELIFRPILSHMGSEANSILRMMLGFYGVNGSGKILKVGDPFEASQPFSVDLEVDLDEPTIFTRSGTLKIPAGINLVDMAALRDLVKADKRRSNMLLGATRFFEKFRIELPPGVASQPLPPPFQFSNSVGTLQSSTKLNGRSIEIEHELVIKKDEIAPDEYLLAKELLQKAGEAFGFEIPYANPSASDKAASQNTRASSSGKGANPQNIFADEALNVFRDPITLKQAFDLELKLKTNPDDLEKRRDLMQFYCNYRYRDTPQRVQARIQHRLWFIEHHPEMTEVDVVGPGGDFVAYKKLEFDKIKAAWVKKVAEQSSNSAIRLNAFDFIKKNDRPYAEQMLVDGIKLDPNNYEFPLRLSKMLHLSENALKPETPIERSDRLKKEFDFGLLAVTDLKKQRSEERDNMRRPLLQDLVQTAFDIGRYDEAGALATELVLDFGKETTDPGYDAAAHIGNIVLGRIALKKGDQKKAAEFLLIAIRAPLRRERSWLPDIDTTLAKELFAAGEKDAVSEYLHLCEALSNLTKEKGLFGYQMKALKRWQDEIKLGKTPSFDFQKP